MINKKKQTFKKHKVGLILGLLALANSIVIGFASFVALPHNKVETTQDVSIKVNSAYNQQINFEMDSFTPFTLHPNGFFDTSTNAVNNTNGSIKITLSYTSSLTVDIPLDISLTNSLDSNFFVMVSAVQFKVGSSTIANQFTSLTGNAITYNDISAEKFGILSTSAGVSKTGKIDLIFTFALSSTYRSDFYNNVFKTLYGKSFYFTLSIQTDLGE